MNTKPFDSTVIGITEILTIVGLGWTADQLLTEGINTPLSKRRLWTWQDAVGTVKTMAGYVEIWKQMIADPKKVILLSTRMAANILGCPAPDDVRWWIHHSDPLERLPAFHPGQQWVIPAGYLWAWAKQLGFTVLPEELSLQLAAAYCGLDPGGMGRQIVKKTKPGETNTDYDKLPAWFDQAARQGRGVFRISRDDFLRWARQNNVYFHLYWSPSMCHSRAKEG